MNETAHLPPSATQQQDSISPMGPSKIHPPVPTPHSYWVGLAVVGDRKILDGA